MPYTVEKSIQFYGHCWGRKAKFRITAGQLAYWTGQVRVVDTNWCCSCYPTAEPSRPRYNSWPFHEYIQRVLGPISALYFRLVEFYHFANYHLVRENSLKQLSQGRPSSPFWRSPICAGFALLLHRQTDANSMQMCSSTAHRLLSHNKQRTSHATCNSPTIQQYF